MDRSAAHRPYQSLKKLTALRHKMVHIGHEVIDDEVVTSTEVGPKFQTCPPLSNAPRPHDPRLSGAELQPLRKLQHEAATRWETADGPRSCDR